MSNDTRVERTLDALVARYALPHGAAAQFAALLRKLAADEHAPSTVTAPSAAVNVHVADSLAGLELAEIKAARTIADLGAGAGFPGLALAVALPAAHVTLVESIARKCAFITAAADAAGIGNVEAVADRAESWTEGAGRCDVVTARALAPLGVIAEYAAPLLVPDGSLVAWKGRRDLAEEADAQRAADQLGLQLTEIRPVAPYDGAEHRHLYVLRKVAPTPSRFPRRPGMARKRPL